MIQTQMIQNNIINLNIVQTDEKKSSSKKQPKEDINFLFSKTTNYDEDKFQQQQ